MEQQKPAILILAAGRGTRMKSDGPKVLHRLLGRPLIEYVINAARYLDPSLLVVVTGYGAEEVEEDTIKFMSTAPKHQPQSTLSPIFVRQKEQLGTGHAVAMAKDALADHVGPLIIMAGDVPLISPNTLEGFYKAHLSLEASISVLTVRMDDPAAYGRIIRDENNWLERIVEFRDADDEQRSINEINSGLYVADTSKLFAAIERLSPDNNQKEYYLTDVVKDFREYGYKAAAVEMPEALAYEVQGINDRYELAEAQEVLKAKINNSWMRGGVSMLDPASTYIEPSVRLAQDVTLWPGVILCGKTSIGPGAEIGPFSRLKDCCIGAKTKIKGNCDLNGLILDDGTCYPNES